MKPSGTKSYVLQYRNTEGRSRCLTLDRHGPVTAERAREKALRLLADAGDGADPVRDWAADASNIHCHILPLLDPRVAKAITAADVARFQADVTTGKSATDERTRARGRAIVTGGQGTAARLLGTLAALLE